MKKIDLQNLPNKPLNEKRTYSEIIIVPQNKKHDSGFSYISVYGCENSKPIEKIDCMDHIQINGNCDIDCFYPSKIIRFFKSGYLFETDSSLSSLEIKLIKM